MITTRPASQRGHFDHGWLKTAHTFSFGQYQHPEWDRFGPLRVINEDLIAPRAGFGKHPHRNMEIISYIVSGTLRHTDSLGHEEDITPSMIQRMSAGSGIHHAEHNPTREHTHMIQIWIEPDEQGLAPTHESARHHVHDQPGKLHTLVSPDGADGSLKIQQDATMSAGLFGVGTSTTKTLEPGRRAWIHIVKGSATLRSSDQSESLDTSDSAGITDSDSFTLEFQDETEVLVFDLP